jgi:ATP-dependent DNA helicase RecG
MSALSDSEIERLLGVGESDRVEWKESLSDTTAIREAICAFANDLPGHGQPGIVLVGVTDRGGAGHPEPEFDVGTGAVLATVRAAP